MIQGVAAEWSFPSLSANKGVNQQICDLHPLLRQKTYEKKRISPKTQLQAYTLKRIIS